MRAGIVAIYTALDEFASLLRVGIFTDSMYSLEATRHHHCNLGAYNSPRYHHHILLLLRSIYDLLETRRARGLSTTIHKTRAHTNIKGNDLADAAAKVAVTAFETLPPEQTLRVEVGAIAPRPSH
jgi:ribonuclease HI